MIMFVRTIRNIKHVNSDKGNTTCVNCAKLLKLQVFLLILMCNIESIRKWRHFANEQQPNNPRKSWKERCVFILFIDNEQIRYQKINKFHKLRVFTSNFIDLFKVKWMAWFSISTWKRHYFLVVLRGIQIASEHIFALKTLVLYKSLFI